MATRIRVVLADDHAIVLSGLRRLFEAEPDFDVVRCCPDGQAAMAAVVADTPDVLVLDLRMPEVTGLDVLRRLNESPTPCRTILLTASLDDEELVEAVRLGVRGIVLKESAPEALLECVRQVHRGGSCLEIETTTRGFGQALDRAAASRHAREVLTARERDIVAMVSQGLRNKVIAERLGITEGTVKIHLHNIYEKANVDGRLALAIWARERGLA
jgi:DNA-binding NarL/FixJ family response regulator